MTIPFTKAHGARNDFLLSWTHELPHLDPRAGAIAICDRHTGVGADGWMLIDRDGPRIRLINSDGSDSEISGNGTRCAAALLVDTGLAGERVVIQTGAGEKRLWLKRREGRKFEFEMDMGRPEVREEIELEGYSAVAMWVGNPQCALICDEIPSDWVERGRRLESHPRWPNRSNISFVRAIDRHTVEARFYERGAGWTMSSGTGSTGAAFAAMHKGLVEPPLTVLTEAGPLAFREESGSLLLTGPAELTARGEFYLPE
ncbi:MAG: diaminopimelate epimerase [Bryobacteraceae bacterium]|nr:diaminopimelate epimerase [Bryobacteraceae bacterium]